MRKSLLLLALVGGFAAPAVAQPVNVVPQEGLVWGYLPKSTYSAGFVGLVPAASTTDIVCIAGSTGKTITLLRAELHGTAGTTLLNPVAMIRRAARNTAGTAASTTANPANTVTKLNTAFGTHAATVISYTANPTITDTSGTILAVRQMGVSLTTMATVGYPAVFDFTNNGSNLLAAGVQLTATAQQICLNLTGTSISSGVLTGQLLWTEE